MQVPTEIPLVVYRKILYASDLSESGRYAFPHAAGMAKFFGAKLTVIHVVESSPDIDRRLFSYIDEAFWEEIKTRNLQEARDLLIQRRRSNAAIEDAVGKRYDDILDAMAAEPLVKYEIVVKMGDPAKLIVQEAESGGYDLIVIGSHGHGLMSAVMGTTVEQVLKHSKIPVLVVRVPKED